MHQDPQPAHQVTALAVLIESSLAIAQEWPVPLFHYCMQLFRRISDAHHPGKFRAAFVGYGTVDTVPSPILCKRFFTENTMVFKEIFEDPMHFGIGMTNSGGTRGMAALEGLVAALEMFDDLKKLQNTKICASFILHIAASPPDNSLRPEWNDSELADDMTWESLPTEFKKRNIAYSLLTLRPPQGRLAELYAAMNTSSDTLPPWFELRPPFILSALSIISLQPVKVLNKRQNEIPAAEQPPAENKRPRLQPIPQDSPKPITRPPPSHPPSEPPLPAQPPDPDPSQTQSQPQAPSQSLPQTQTQPAAPPVAQPPSQIPNVPVPQIPMPSTETLIQRLSFATEVMRKLEIDLQDATVAGDVEKLSELRAEYERKKPQYDKLRLMMQYKQVAMRQSSAQSTNDPGTGNDDNMPIGNAIPPQSATSPEMSHPQTNLQMAEMHSSTSNPPMNPPMPNMMSNANIQIQKMMEQKQLLHQMGSNNVAMGMQNPNPMAPPFPGGGESVVGIPQHMTRLPVPEWTGTLKCSGQGPHGTREVQCSVSVASALAPEKAHPATWPKTMELSPVDKIPMLQLQEWIKKQQTCLCSFRAFPTDDNRASYGMLMQLLLSTHAVASWTVPSGTHPTRNAIFFTYQQRTMSIIAGAVFPLTGIPDSLPKAIPQQMGGLPTPHHIPQGVPPGMPPHMYQALKAMSPAQREQILNQWAIRQQFMRQQAQTSQLANQQAGISSFNPNMQHSGNQSNMASALSMMAAGGGANHGNFMVNRNSQTQGGLPGSMTGSLGNSMPMISGGPTGGNMSFEGLRTMIQRNANNGMNMGQNMGQ